MTGATAQSEHTRDRGNSSRAVRPSAAAGVFIWVVALLLYASTSAPGIAELFDDSLEFQLVAPTFGIAHPTGYPLYTMSGGLWSRFLFPFGNWAWRMNIYSALAAATAVLLVYMVAARLLPRPARGPDIGAGLAAAAAFTLGPVWWSQATVAEVYALHNLFVAAILLITLTIPPLFDETRIGCDGRVAVRRMTLLFFVAGLAMAHHRTTLMLIPGVAVYLVWSVPGLWRPRKAWLLWFGAFLVPLALYLYLPVRAGQGVVDLNGSYVNNVQGFLNHILARAYGGFFDDNTLGSSRTARDVLGLIQTQLGLAAGALAIAGMLAMPFHSAAARKNWALLLLVLVANLVFALLYQVADWQVFFLPTLLVLALYAGAGVGFVAGLFGERPRAAAVTAAALALLILAGAGRKGPINRSDDWDAHQYAYLLGAVAYPEGSRVIGLEGEVTALKYIQAAEQMAGNATPVTADLPAARAAAIAQSVEEGRATFITRELPGIEELYSFGGEGPLVRVWPRGEADVIEAAHALDAELVDGRLRLVGYEPRVLELPGGPVLELTLDWLPMESLPHTIKVSLRLQDAQGNPVMGASGQPVVVDEFPIRQVAPSTTWLPGEVVRDVHRLSFPDAGSGASVLLIVYDAATVAEYGRIELPVP